MKQTLIDLTGYRFGRLEVVSRAENDSRGEARWNCLCACGNISIVLGSHLRRGAVVSCGCFRKEATSKRQKTNPAIPSHVTHGHSHDRLYTTWANMKTRCFNSRNRAYKWYGERGITVCDKWNDFMTFYSWAINSGYADNLTIDRIDPNGNYEESNCRWITIQEQQANRRAPLKCS